eukprot:TRINITY_DN1264_c0_g1_i1.p2 TRINITY_DN1264_c0_g1~~TRINITY_DN1264_c0_g1_i1.p2  ORF type:complete len:104 (-),score=11.28 TRINITY_DN1264_c0_g1_i1:118-429(-)
MSSPTKTRSASPSKTSRSQLSTVSYPALSGTMKLTESREKTLVKLPESTPAAKAYKDDLKPDYLASDNGHLLTRKPGSKSSFPEPQQSGRASFNFTTMGYLHS